MEIPKISVIVPIYNVGNYIYECLDSIANQTMIDDLEVILVDDGSTDNCGYVIDRDFNAAINIKQYGIDYVNKTFHDIRQFNFI